MNELCHDRLGQLCVDLKLAGVMDAYPALAAQASEGEHSFTDFLESLLIAERDFLRARSSATLVRMAGFPAIQTLEGEPLRPPLFRGQWRATSSSRARPRSARASSWTPAKTYRV